MWVLGLRVCPEIMTSFLAFFQARWAGYIGYIGQQRVRRLWHQFPLGAYPIHLGILIGLWLHGSLDQLRFFRDLLDLGSALSNWAVCQGPIPLAGDKYEEDGCLQVLGVLQRHPVQVGQGSGDGSVPEWCRCRNRHLLRGHSLDVSIFCKSFSTLVSSQTLRLGFVGNLDIWSISILGGWNMIIRWPIFWTLIEKYLCKNTQGSEQQIDLNLSN